MSRAARMRDPDITEDMLTIQYHLNVWTTTIFITEIGWLHGCNTTSIESILVQYFDYSIVSHGDLSALMIVAGEIVKRINGTCIRLFATKASTRNWQYFHSQVDLGSQLIVDVTKMELFR